MQSAAFDLKFGTCIVVMRFAKSSKPFKPIHRPLLTTIFVSCEFLGRTSPDLGFGSRLVVPHAHSQPPSSAPCRVRPKALRRSYPHDRALHGNGPARPSYGAGSNV